MGKLRRTIAVLPAAAIGMAYTQIRRAAHRPDLPSFSNQDPSGTFGQAGLTPLRIVALGDSSITAPGVEDLDNMWLRRIARTLSNDYSVELISVAVGGSKSRDVLANQLESAKELKPDIAVISVGANDAIRATPVYRYRKEMQRIIAELNTASGAVFVLGLGDLGSIPRLPPMLRSSLSRRAARFDAAAGAIAATATTGVKPAHAAEKSVSETSPSSGARGGNPIAVSTYSFWRFRKDSKLHVDKCIDYAGEMGFDAVELLEVQMHRRDNAYLQELKRKAFTAGMDLCGMSTHQGFVSPDRDKRRKNIDLTIKQIEIAYKLGIPSIRINTGRWGTSGNFHSYR